MHVGEIHVLPVSNFYIIMLLRKASVGMYSGCDYLLSLKISFVYFLALSSLLPPSILFNCFTLVSVLFYCMSATIVSIDIDGRCRSSRVRVKVVATPFVNSP